MTEQTEPRRSCCGGGTSSQATATPPPPEAAQPVAEPAPQVHPAAPAVPEPPTDATTTELLPPSPGVLDRLVQSHREFLAFLRPRVPSDAVAEEILQAAFVRTLEKGGGLREDESAVAWFYRLLRNALVDYYRKRDTERRAIESEAREPRDSESDAVLSRTVCGCMKTLLPTLNPGYAELLERVDLEERAVGDVASELGLTANNASVRLHRARKALRLALEKSCGTCATHGCLDCSCGSPHRID